MIHLIVSSVVFGLLGIIWTRETVLNLLFKVFFYGMAIWGLLLYLGKA